MTEQDNHITPDQNTPDNNTTEQTTTQLNAPHYITKSTQHNTKNLPLQVLGIGTLALTPMNPWDGMLRMGDIIRWTVIV